MPPVGFETTISAGERPKTYALERAATGTGKTIYMCVYNISPPPPKCSRHKKFANGIYCNASENF